MIRNGTPVLVTGADGFIGSHLAEMLVRTGANVTGLAQYSGIGHRGWLEHLPELRGLRVILGDIRDPHFCLDLTRGIDVVFHLAALNGIPYSYQAPDSYIATNVKGTLNICQGCLANGVSRLVHTSTSEVYGSARYVPMDEAHPLSPQSPYSASKLGADAIALSYCRSYSLPVVIARPFNTYGPRQTARAIIPTIISQIAAGYTRIALGNLEPTRDFTYVEDTCTALIKIAECQGGIGEVFNIGSCREVSIRDLFHAIAELMCSAAQPVEDDCRRRPPESEVSRLLCNNDKLFLATGFRPTIPLAEGLRATIDWFTAGTNPRLYKPDIYNV